MKLERTGNTDKERLTEQDKKCKKSHLEQPSFVWPEAYNIYPFLEWPVKS